ncbi:MAG: hypothetical protein AB3N19_18490 [Ruegeria sp.]
MGGIGDHNQRPVLWRKLRVAFPKSRPSRQLLDVFESLDLKLVTHWVVTFQLTMDGSKDPSFFPEIVMMIRAILAASLIAMGSQAASDEPVTIYSAGAWTVTRLISGEYKDCTARVVNDDGHRFGILLSRFGPAIFIHFKDVHWPEHHRDVKIRVDNFTWNLTGAGFYKKSISFEFERKDVGFKFVSDLFGSDVVALKKLNGKTDFVTWNFDGSSKALSVLAECHQQFVASDD